MLSQALLSRLRGLTIEARREAAQHGRQGYNLPSAMSFVPHE